MKREAIREFFRRLHDANPNPQTELEYASPYQLLVAVVLSAQATDRSVNLATRKLFALAPTPEAMVSLGEEGIADEEVRDRLIKAADEAYADRVEKNTPDVMRYIEKQVVLQMLDHLWREHIVNLDHLRSVVGFRGYAQRDPLQEYKAEAFELFQALLANLRDAVTMQMSRVELVRDPPPAPTPPPMEGHHLDATTGEDDFAEGAQVPPQDRNPLEPKSWGTVGRNEPCPCGSGKKYKHCHGQVN